MNTFQNTKMGRLLINGTMNFQNARFGSEAIRIIRERQHLGTAEEFNILLESGKSDSKTVLPPRLLTLHHTCSNPKGFFWKLQYKHVEKMVSVASPRISMCCLNIFGKKARPRAFIQ